MRTTLYASAIALAAFGGWAACAHVPTIVRAEGRVVPAGRLMPLASFEGGVVEEVLVKEGAAVVAGQPLLRLGPAQAQAQAGEQAATAGGLHARIARLKAEIDGGEPAFASDIDPNLAQAERDTLAEHRRELGAKLAGLARDAEGQRASAAAARAEHAALEAQLVPAQRQAAALRALANQGAGSRGDADRAEGTVAEIRSRMAALPGRAQAAEAAAQAAEAKAEEARASFAGTARREQAEATSRVAAVEEQMKGSADRLLRTEITAPVAGIVQTVNAAPGRVARTGETLLELVPTSGDLLLEGRVRAADVGHLRPGLPVRVRLTAYDYTRYGSVPGRLAEISPDSVVDERTREVFFKVQVRAEAKALAGRPIGVGMVAELDVQSGSRTVLEYILSPVHRTADLALAEP